MDIDHHALPVDEISDPGRAFAKVDGDFAVGAESQELALNRTGRDFLHRLGAAACDLGDERLGAHHQHYLAEA